MSCFLRCCPVFLFLLLAVWLYYCYVILYCCIFLQHLVKRCCYLVVFHILFTLLVWSYFMTTCTELAEIPTLWHFSEIDHARLDYYEPERVQRKLGEMIAVRKLDVKTVAEDGTIRYCQECHIIKPDRAHHCSTCDTCVLKMDHHCPWISICVSFSNYKHFILTLMYVVLLCVFYVCTIAEYIVKFWKHIGEHIGELQIVIGYWYICALVIGFFLLILFFYHVALVLKNQTTLESMRPPTFWNPNLTFDMGIRKNFTQVFGVYPCLWLLPVNTTEGDGLKFEARNMGV